MHETDEKCIEMPGPENGTPLTRLLWPFGCKVLKSQCTKQTKSASKCPVRRTALYYIIAVGSVPAIFCAGTEPILCLGKYPMHNAVHT